MMKGAGNAFVFLVLGGAVCPTLSLQQLSPSNLYLESLSTANRWDFRGRNRHTNGPQVSLRQSSSLKMSEDNWRNGPSSQNNPWDSSSFNQTASVNTMEEQEKESYRNYMRAVADFTQKAGALQEFRPDLSKYGVSTPPSFQRDPTADAMSDYFKRQQEAQASKNEAEGGQAGSYLDFLGSKTQNEGSGNVQTDLDTLAFEREMEAQEAEYQDLNQGNFPQDPNFSVSNEVGFEVPTFDRMPSQLDSNEVGTSPGALEPPSQETSTSLGSASTAKSDGDGTMDAYLAAIAQANAGRDSKKPPETQAPVSNQFGGTRSSGSYLDAMSPQDAVASDSRLTPAFEQPETERAPATEEYAPWSNQVSSTFPGDVAQRDPSVDRQSGGSYLDALAQQVSSGEVTGTAGQEQSSFPENAGSTASSNARPDSVSKDSFSASQTIGSYLDNLSSQPPSVETGLDPKESTGMSANAGSYLDAMSSQLASVSVQDADKKDSPGVPENTGSYPDAMSSLTPPSLETAPKESPSYPQNVGSFLDALSARVPSSSENGAVAKDSSGFPQNAGSYLDAMSSRTSAGVETGAAPNEPSDLPENNAQLDTLSSQIPSGVGSDSVQKRSSPQNAGSYLDALASQVSQSAEAGITQRDSSVSSDVGRNQGDAALQSFLREKGEKPREYATGERSYPYSSYEGSQKNKEDATADQSLLSSMGSFFNAEWDNTPALEALKKFDPMAALKEFDLPKYFSNVVNSGVDTKVDLPKYLSNMVNSGVDTNVDLPKFFSNVVNSGVDTKVDLQNFFSNMVNSGVDAKDQTAPVSEYKEHAPLVEESYSQTVQESIPKPELDESHPFYATTTTYRVMTRSDQGNGNLNNDGGSRTYEAFQRLDDKWKRLKESKPFTYEKSKRLARAQKGIPPPHPFVSEDGGLGKAESWVKLIKQRDIGLDFDVAVCGGTLGIFYAAALQAKGLSVCVLSPSDLNGSEQEWNVSMEDLLELERLGVLSEDDIDAAITSRYPGCRSGFKNQEVSPIRGGFRDNKIGYECVEDNVMNVGVTPALLLERVAKRFKEQGGVIKEEVSMGGIAVSEFVGAAVDIGDTEPITANLVLDCLGNDSPVTRQQRYGTKPDGICAVVGSCAKGYDPDRNVLGDIIYSNSEIQQVDNSMLQLFWESFPVKTDVVETGEKKPVWDPYKGSTYRNLLSQSSDEKTTYMFAYMDAERESPSLESLFEEYWQSLPRYQPPMKSAEYDLDFQRFLFAYFPTYKSSPLKSGWNRVLAVGDASGTQNPLGFGGFRALSRDIGRVTGAIAEAVEIGCLHKDDLQEINPYAPNLSALWMFQKAMSVRSGQRPDPKFVNRLLATAFQGMNENGSVKPFLKGVVRFDTMMVAVAKTMFTDPLFMKDVIGHVGLPTLIDWLGHVRNMAWYGFLDEGVSPIVEKFVDKARDPRVKFQWNRRMEAWKYGSGNDLKPRR